MYGKNQYGTINYGSIGEEGNIITVTPVYVVSNTGFGDLVGTIIVQSSNTVSSTDIGGLAGKIPSTPTNTISQIPDALLGKIMEADQIYITSNISQGKGIGKPFLDTLIIVNDYNSKILEVSE